MHDIEIKLSNILVILLPTYNVQVKTKIYCEIFYIEIYALIELC